MAVETNKVERHKAKVDVEEDAETDSVDEVDPNAVVDVEAHVVEAEAIPSTAKPATTTAEGTPASDVVDLTMTMSAKQCTHRQLKLR